jgi:hypothetical protein
MPRRDDGRKRRARSLPEIVLSMVEAAQEREAADRQTEGGQTPYQRGAGRLGEPEGQAPDHPRRVPRQR